MQTVLKNKEWEADTQVHPSSGDSKWLKQEYTTFLIQIWSLSFPQP